MSRQTYAGPNRRTAVSQSVTVQGLAVLRGAAQALAAAGTTEEIAEVAVRAGVEAVGASGGTLALRQHGSGTVTLRSTDGYSPRLVEAYPELPLSAALPVCHTARTGETLLLPDRESALARFPDAAAHHRLSDDGGAPIVGAVVQPLLAAAGLLGSLALTWDTEKVVGPGEVELTAALAALVAQALVRVRDEQRLQDALTRATLLARSGDLLVAGLDRDAVLRALVALVEPVLGEHTIVELLNDDGTADLAVDTCPAGVGALVRRSAPGADAQSGLEVLRAPLAARGRHLGSVTAVRTNPGRSAVADGPLLRDGAGRAALALDHALLYAEQRDTSLALQQALLTAPPDAVGLEIGVRYLPATHAAVGGDWYDAFVVPDGRTLLVIGDVVGHDAQAAAGMGQLRGVLRTLAYADGGGPADVLGRTETTAAGLGVAVLATALVASVEDTQSPGGRGGQDGAYGRILVWANAGHPPPVLIHTGGAVELLARDPDVMLGAESRAARAEHRWPLAAGDTVLLYTDGLVERRDADLDAGLHRLRRACAALASLPPDSLCEALIELMLPEGADDDVALLAVRVLDRGGLSS